MLKPLLLAASAAATFAGGPAFAQAAGEDNALVNPSCDRACLLGNLESYMAALAAGDAARLPLADDVVFTENDVPISLDRGLWSTVTAVDKVGLEAADPITGNAAWFGSVRERGNPAIYAVRIHVENGLIDEIETVVHRKGALACAIRRHRKHGARPGISTMCCHRKSAALASGCIPSRTAISIPSS